MFETGASYLLKAKTLDWPLLDPLSPAPLPLVPLPDPLPIGLEELPGDKVE